MVVTVILVFALTTEEVQNKNKQIEALIEEISIGDTSAMGRLYDLIKTDVFAYALSKLGSKQDACDIMQDTFVQVYKYAKQYTPKGKPMAWVITIELNLIRRYFQLNSRNVGFDESIMNKPLDQNFEQSVVNNTFLTELLNNLSEEEREIITLHVVSGMKHIEIAKVLSKPLSTVLSKYNRAIKKLQLIVKEGK